MRKQWIVIALALILYTPLFIFKKAGAFDFWNWMALVVCIILTVITLLNPQWPRTCITNCRKRFWQMTGMGIVSALVLYLIFFVGNWLSRLIFPFAANNIHHVYALKSNVSVLRVSLLIGFLIGPAEELIWRAYVQETLSRGTSEIKAVLIATGFYTAIHLGSGNVMLILAAMVCGLFWGGLYMRFRSVWLNVISHTVWDLAVFIFFPFH